MNQKISKMAKKKKTPKKRMGKTVVQCGLDFGVEELPDKGPQYMIQISDPKMLRKDILESLREIIIFRQGYDKFKAIQNEKILLFCTLKEQLKEINCLVDQKLRRYLPKGKLKSVLTSEFRSQLSQEMVKECYEETKEELCEIHPVVTELDNLENQLSEIEKQLEKIK